MILQKSPLSSDGASVMTGCLNVGVKLKCSINPRLMQIYCAAHRLVLAAGHACSSVRSLNEYH